MLFAEPACKSRGDAELIGLLEKRLRDSACVFYAHAGHREIDLGAADLRLIYGDIADFDFAQISKPSPGGELRFDRECDQDFHDICSDAGLEPDATPGQIVGATKTLPPQPCAWRDGL